MKNKLTIIISLLICPLMYCQGLSLNNLLELRPKSISELDIALNSFDYKLKSAAERNNIKQLEYENKNSKFDESLIIQQQLGRDSFIIYFYDSFKIGSNLLEQIKVRNATLVQEKVSENGNIIIVYHTNEYTYFFVKNEDISSITIYTTKDFEKYYK